jgi:hypothetical protein
MAVGRLSHPNIKSVSVQRTVSGERRVSILVLVVTHSVLLVATCILVGIDLTLSNPIFLPPAYSPALIYFGREGGSSDIMIFLFPTLFLM